MLSSIFSAERTSAANAAERPIRERQLAAYYRALEYVEGRHALEVGCGEGIGTSILAGKAASMVAVDYSQKALEVARGQYAQENITFTQMKVPPLDFDDMSFDAVVCFQMIEHLQRPEDLIAEVQRVLRGDGLALFATPNKEETISENPFHLHEFFAQEFRELLLNHFGSVELYGVHGDELFMVYWQSNKKWVRTFMRIDMFNLSHHLPLRIKQKLFSVASQLMRTSLKRWKPDLCDSIRHENFLFRHNDLSGCLDFFAVCRKLS